MRNEDAGCRLQDAGKLVSLVLFSYHASLYSVNGQGWDAFPLPPRIHNPASYLLKFSTKLTSEINSPITIKPTAPPRNKNNSVSISFVNPSVSPATSSSYVSATL